MVPRVKAIAVHCHESVPRLYETTDLEFLAIHPDPAGGRRATLFASGDGILLTYTSDSGPQVTLVRSTAAPRR